VWLFWVNVALAGTLVAVIVAAAVRMLWRVARGRFGSRLLLKLAAIFALVGILPGVLIYAVSYQFVSRSIESWFDIKVEGALSAGLNLGRGTIDSIVADLGTKTRLAAERLGETALSAEPLALERLREQLSAKEVSVVGSSGQTLLATASASASLMPERIPLQTLRQARTQRVVSQAEGLEDDATAAANARVRAVALIPSSNFALGEQERFLVVTQPIAPTLAANAIAVTTAYGEYQQRALARSGLRKMYIGTLTLALVLAVFGALLLAIALSNQLAQPLLLLAEGVAQVARGDFSSKAVFRSRDELGGLTRSFAEMTEQLSEARELVHRASRRSRARAPTCRRSSTTSPPASSSSTAAARSTPSTRARRGSCACRSRPTAAAGSTRSPASAPSARRCGSASSCTPRAPKPASATTGRTRSSCRSPGRRTASATRSRCSCAARRCRRARG
jgi:nitrogen fixation/metabolism regulation signal transduction histidine kinase